MDILSESRLCRGRLPMTCVSTLEDARALAVAASSMSRPLPFFLCLRSRPEHVSHTTRSERNDRPFSASFDKDTVSHPSPPDRQSSPGVSTVLYSAGPPHSSLATCTKFGPTLCLLRVSALLREKPRMRIDPITPFGSHLLHSPCFFSSDGRSCGNT